jgi:hypothetical protein
MAPKPPNVNEILKGDGYSRLGKRNSEACDRQDQAIDHIARQVADLVGNLLEAKWQKFPSTLIEVAERMEQVGSGAADSRDLFARYKLLFTSRLLKKSFCGMDILWIRRKSWPIARALRGF